MKTIDIRITHPEKKYTVSIGAGLIDRIAQMVDLESYTQMFIITDSTVVDLYLSALKDALCEAVSRKQIHSFSFPAGEKSKQLATVEDLYHQMAKQGVDRRSLVVNLGGGVVTDLGGFAASTFQRGIPFINMPTTLEGMVDASVGGKTGINLGTLKNYVGTFAQPRAVIIDVSTLKTLPQRVFLQGYAEVLKHGLIADKMYFKKAGEKSPLEMNEDELIALIARSVEIKARIVQEDEKENGARKLLNFGHTIGHVIESLSFKTADPLYHGEAVAIGMIAEAQIAESAGMISEDELRQIEEAIKRVGLPTRFDIPVSSDEIMELLHTDKKNVGGKVKWTLLMGIGVGEFNIEVAERFVREGISYILCKQ